MTCFVQPAVLTYKFLLVVVVKQKNETKPARRQMEDQYVLYVFTAAATDPPQTASFLCSEMLRAETMSQFVY